jgi:hypothetical protein
VPKKDAADRWLDQHDRHKVSPGDRYHRVAVDINEDLDFDAKLSRAADSASRDVDRETVALYVKYGKQHLVPKRLQHLLKDGAPAMPLRCAPKAPSSL